MAIQISKAFKKECERAAYEYSGKHFWGDKTNAGVNYKRGKNKPEKSGK